MYPQQPILELHQQLLRTSCTAVVTHYGTPKMTTHLSREVSRVYVHPASAVQRLMAHDSCCVAVERVEAPAPAN